MQQIKFRDQSGIGTIVREDELILKCTSIFTIGIWTSASNYNLMFSVDASYMTLHKHFFPFQRMNQGKKRVRNQTDTLQTHLEHCK